MNIKLFFCVIALIGSALTIKAQGQSKVITLGQVLDSVMKHSPISSQRFEVNQLGDVTDNQIKAVLYPSINASGQASIQSDVTSLPISIPGITIPEMAKDWYKVNIDLSQIVYDGGQVKQTRILEHTNQEVKLLEIEQQENSLREMISKLYFRAILLRQQQKVYASALRGLESSAEELSKSVKEGSVLISSLQSMQAEIMRTRQQMLETEANLSSTHTMIEGFSKFPINSSDSLLLPTFDDPNIAILQQKADWLLLQKQIDKTKIQQQLSKAKRRPSVQAFAQAGYGRPGYNMLDDNFDDYYMAGIRFNYKLWDWKTSWREQNLLKLSGDFIKKSQQAFEINQTATYKAKEAEILYLKQIIDSDKEIVRLQEEIIRTYKASLMEGSITTSVYIQEVEKLTRARINQETNAIRLINSKAELMYITGKYAIHE